MLFDPLKCALTLIIPNGSLTIPQELENRLTNVCQSGNEFVDVLKSTQEASDLSLSPRRRHVKDGYDIIWICLYTSLFDHVSEELPKSHSKSVFLGIQSQSELSDPLKESLQGR